ncbi:MAG: glucosidase, partial [Candidatus Eremiobacteraeota bacterium]|nr:glucosidase [Candidatus Eremiobacteraeota bacterium]
TWWVNREDPQGENVFMGGFLGLDNIGVFDRSSQLPTGGHIVQSDATSWMAVYALDMMAIALELAQHNPSYEDIASKFFEHFLYIAYAINDDTNGLWNEPDGFYYDRLVLPDGRQFPMRVRSLVGLLPLLAVETLQPELMARLPNFKRRLEWFVANRPELSKNIASLSKGVEQRALLALLDGERLQRLLKVMLDEADFLSPYGIRSLSKYHRDRPLVVRLRDVEFRVDYDPAESRSGLFGGNSNWRGPVWFPLNFLLIEALQNFHFFYGDSYRVEFPTGSGSLMTLWDIATELSRRLISIFERDERGDRPFNGGSPKLQRDPHFRDLLLFYEYFHGDNGAGIGASHQTGWTGLVAKLVQQVSEYDSAGKSPLEWQYEATPAGDGSIASTA